MAPRPNTDELIQLFESGKRDEAAAQVLAYIDPSVIRPSGHSVSLVEYGKDGTFPITSDQALDNVRNKRQAFMEVNVHLPPDKIQLPQRHDFTDARGVVGWWINKGQYQLPA